MELICNIFVLLGAVIWMSILLLPWRPWSTREFLDADSPASDEDLSDITVLIPARNEEVMIQSTLSALQAQGRDLNIVVVDDRSTDYTAQTARDFPSKKVRVISGQPLPPGWSGKLWALEQGRRHIRTPLTLLLDADIEPQPGIVTELRKTMRHKNVHLISLMAVLRMKTFWERLLMPAFVYFFKLLYPFHLSNSAISKVAAAAGGCILMETRLLDEIGGFHVLRGELIDDCALALRVKAMGGRTWTGLTHSVISLRPYNNLRAIWNMVARTAFTQLRYSNILLALCTIMMIGSFWLPAFGLLAPTPTARVLSAVGLCCMLLGYLPTLKFYGMPGWWALTMPMIGSLYLAMTWNSAARHWLGRGSQWKGRAYSRNG
jgi:hopene-associated glycosyltransferase HpnB